MSIKYNILIVGAGHYVTGSRAVSDDSATDKDLGVLLPSVAYLQQLDKVGDITIVARDGDKLYKNHIKWKEKYYKLARKVPDVKLRPKKGVKNDKEYKCAIEECLSDNTLIFIVTPDSTHEDILTIAASRGCNAFIVKPIVSSYSAYQRLERIYSDVKTDVFCYVDYHKLFDPQNILLYRQVKECEYGTINFVYSIQTQKKIMQEIYSNEISENKNFNVNHYLGSHYIHQTSYMFGGTPVSVRATGQGSKSRLLDNLSELDMIEVHVVWETDRGTFSSMHVSGWNDPNGQPFMTRQQYNIFGTDGSAYLNQDNRGMSSITNDVGTNIINPHFFMLPSLDDYTGYAPSSLYGIRSIEYFIDMSEKVRLGRLSLDKIKNHPNFLGGSKNVSKILTAADESLKDNSIVVEL